MEDIKSKNLFICSSPYTVFNSLNYVLNNINDSFNNSDIVIFHKTTSMTKISEGLKKSGVFNRVYDYKDFQKSRYLPIIALLTSMFPRIMFKLVNKSSSDNLYPEGYETIISQNYLFSTLLGRMNKLANYYLIEDGLGSYTSRVSIPHKRSIYMRLANKLLFGGNLIVKCDRQYVYRPEIITEDRIMAYKLPSMNKNHFDVYKNVFGFIDNNIYSNFQFVLFGDGEMESCVKTDTLNNQKINKYDIYKKYILTDIPRENIIYRAHPVEKNITSKLGKLNLDEINNLWEIECMDQIDENNILINYFSTAVASPKILYDKEPYLLFLYHLSESEESKIEIMTDYVESLMKLYSDPNKIIVINDVAELKGRLKELCKERE